MRDFRLCGCGGEMYLSEYCGVFVCNDCDAHIGLARCFCGWALSGSNGRHELEDFGEVIEQDEY